MRRAGPSQGSLSGSLAALEGAFDNLRAGTLHETRDGVNERPAICLVIRAGNPGLSGTDHTLVTGPHVLMRDLTRVDPQLAATRTAIMDENQRISGKRMVSVLAAGQGWECVELVVSVAGTARSRIQPSWSTGQL